MSIIKAAAERGRKIGTTLRSEWKVIPSVVARFPSTWAFPLLLLLLLLGLEIPGIHYYKHQLIRARKARSHSLTESVASALQLQVQLAFRPMSGMETLIQSTPHWPDLQKSIISFGNNSLLQAGGMIDGVSKVVLSVAPNGHGALLFPLELQAITSLNGSDLLNDNNRDINLKTISEVKTLYYPVWGVDAFAVTKAVFIKNAAPNETFGFPLPPTNCSVCYDPVQKQRFWGFVSISVLSSAILQPRQHELDKLFKYYLLAPMDGSMPFVQERNFFVSSTKIVKVDKTDCMLLGGSSSAPERSKSEKALIKVTDSYNWWLVVETSYMDLAILMRSLLSALILGTLIICAMLFSTLLARRKHQMLLESLVPDSVIKQAQAQAGYLSSSKPLITAGSTADLMLQVASDVAAGKLPAISDALTLRTAVLQKWDLYTPINLAKQLKQGPLEADVADALLHELLGQNDRLELRVNQLMQMELLQVLEDANLTTAWSSKWFDNVQTGLSALISSSFTALWRIGPQASAEELADDTCPTIDTMAVDRLLLDRAEKVLLLACSTWQFDVFELAEATNGFPLSALAFFLVHQQGLIKHFKLDSTKLARFLRRIEEGYQDSNPYHNSMHAADVVHKMHLILTEGGLLNQGYADELLMLAAYIAAVVHDYNHGGLTNDFLINTQDDLACQYNDKSPLENHHIAAAWFLLRQSSMNFLSYLSKFQWTTLRKTVIELVLATDMKQHFSIVTRFNATIGIKPPASEPIEGAVICELYEEAVDEAGQITVLQMALKCADLGHTSAALSVHKRWLERLEEEFFKQGDREAELNLPISPLFDRNKPGASKSQVGFYNVVVLPMYSAFCSAFPGARPLLDGARANFMHWQAIQASSAS